jgi:hypothetical protein
MKYIYNTKKKPWEKIKFLIEFSLNQLYLQTNKTILDQSKGSKEARG